jgi:hypothetical protein
MAICKVAGCNNYTSINPKTGHYNMLCFEHFKEQQRITSNKSQDKKHRLSGGPTPKTDRRLNTKGDRPPHKHKPKVVKSIGPELFVLRGHTLTINYTGKTNHVNVNRLTRAVKYNADKEGSSGKIFHYVIDVKQGIEVVANILFDNKAEREREFAKLQAMLSKL